MFQTTNQIPIAMCNCQREFTSWHSICSWNCQSTTPAANNLCLPADLPSGHGDGSSSMMFPAVNLHYINLHYTSIYGRCKPIFSMNCPIIFPAVKLQFSSQWDDVHLWVYHRSFHSLRTKMVHICPRWRKKSPPTPLSFIDVVRNETHIHAALDPCATNAGTHEEPAARFTCSNLRGKRWRPRKSMVWFKGNHFFQIC